MIYPHICDMDAPPLWLPSSNLFKVMSSDMNPKAALKLIAADPMDRSHLQSLKWTLRVHKKASDVGCLEDFTLA